MSKVLVIGNVLKDVYLRLDERHAKLEQDEKDTKWLDLSFDGSSNKFFERVSVFGGAAVTMEVLNDFEIDVTLNGPSNAFRRATSYRYILCADDNITYFVPSKRAVTNFVEPDEKPDWIFVDRSAVLNDNVAAKIKKYLQKNPAKLVIYAPKEMTETAKILVNEADLVFAENDAIGTLSHGEICVVGDDFISMGGAKVSYKTNREDFMTHLTIKSIAAASVLGAILQDETAYDSLLIAKENVENATLSQTTRYGKLKKMIALEKERLKNLRYLAKSFDEKENYGFVPVVLNDGKRASFADIKECFNTGSRFARLKINTETDAQMILRCIENCHNAMLVPILDFEGDRKEKNSEFLAKIKEADTKNIDWESVVVEI